MQRSGQETIVIERLAFGGDGVGRLASGKVCFVPLTAPGDRVTVRITQEKPRQAFGRIDALVEPSPGRAQPRCAHFGVCGGCQLQHIPYDGQLQAKRQQIVEAVERQYERGAGALVRPIVASPQPFRYRSRITLHLSRGRWGYVASGSRDIVEATHCDIAADGLIETAGRIPESDRSKLETWGMTEATIRQDERGGIDLLLGPPIRQQAPVRQPLPAELHEMADRLREIIGARGVRIGDAASGTLLFEYSTGGCRFVAGPGVFTQVNLAANRLLVDAIIRTAADFPGARVADLYGGIGNFALPLRRAGHPVLSVDSYPLAVDCGIYSAAVDGMAERAQFVCIDVARAETHVRAWRPDIVLLDPPRAGAADSAVWIARLGVQRIVYVSCHPPAMARDLRTFRDAGYMLKEVTPFDLFPQTGQIEAVAVMDKRT